MYTLLCALCEGSVTVNHGNFIGYIGFRIVVVMLIQDKVRKNKAKKEADRK